VSTKIGIIAEGPIDHVLLPALLERIARDRAGYEWPVTSEDVAELFPIKKRGHGGVLAAVRRLVRVLDTVHFDHAFFVILLDRRTRAVQQEIRKLLKNRDRFALGIAIEELEAWWLGDRASTLAWTHLAVPPPGSRYAAAKYKAEKDPEPKKTLDELTRLSDRFDRFDRFYGEGNTDMAADFAEDYWRHNAALDSIRAQCPQGYKPFEKVATNRFRKARSAPAAPPGAAPARWPPPPAAPIAPAPAGPSAPRSRAAPPARTSNSRSDR
jgi:hypothetical protein